MNNINFSDYILIAFLLMLIIFIFGGILDYARFIM